MSHSQFVLLVVIQQVFAILALMTKWLSSLPRAHMRTPAAEMSHAATDETLAADLNGAGRQQRYHQDRRQHRASSTGQYAQNRSTASLTGGAHLEPAGTSSLRRVSSERPVGEDEQLQHGLRQHQSTMLHNTGEDDTLGSSSSLSEGDNDDNSSHGVVAGAGSGDAGPHHDERGARRSKSERSHRMSRAVHDTTTSSLSRHSATTTTQHRRRPNRVSHDEQPVHLSGADLDQAIINSKIATNYKQTFHNSTLIDDVTYRLAKLHIAYQTLVMIIIIIFG